MAFELFKPIYRTVQSPVDLNVLASSYNTLEKGHQQAVDTSAAYITALGDLPVNEAERPYIQKHINSIQQTINNEKVYGNAYAALDDIKMLAAKISSDPGLKGRIKAEADYQNYIKNLEANNKISDDTKEMYRDINKYYYEDKYDKNGNIVGGTNWQPIKHEVDTIPLNNLIIQSIQLAAKDKGSNTSTRWLNAAGQPTTNPGEAVDGEVYNNTTQSWERLGEEKIMQMLQGLIETTPGAKSSIQQDYEVALYKRKKYGSNPDVEDKNGVPLSAEDYLMKRIKPSVAAAAYNNVTTSTTYGEGLKTYKAAQKAASAAAGAGVSAYNSNNPYGYNSQSTPITLTYDYAANLKSAKQNSSNTLKAIYKSISGNDLNLNLEESDSETINNAIFNVINNANLDAPTKSKYILQTRKALRDLEEARYNYNQITDKLGNDEDKLAKLEFITAINGGAEIDANNPYGGKIIENFKNLIGDNGTTIRYRTNDDEDFNKVLSVLNGIDKDGAKKQGYVVGTDAKGNKYIDLNKNNYNKIVTFANAINSSRKIGFMDGVNKLLSLTRSEVVVLDKDGNIVDTPSDNFAAILTEKRFNAGANVILDNISRIYKNASNDIEQELALIAPQTITINNANLPFRSFAEQQLLHNYELGLIEEKQYNLLDKQLSSDLTNKIINHNYAQTEMYSVIDNDGYGTLERQVDSKDRVNIGNNIKAAVGGNRYKISAAHNAVHGSGSNITIYPSVDEKGEAKGTAVTYFIPGLITTEASMAFENNAATKANDKITIGNEVGKRIMLSSDIETPSTGYQYIDCLGGDQFIYSRDNQKFNIDRSGAVTIAQYMDEYQDIKDAVISGDIYIGAKDINQINQRLDSAIELISTKIATAYGNPSDALYLKNTLINDLMK